MDIWQYVSNVLFPMGIVMMFLGIAVVVTLLVIFSTAKSVAEYVASFTLVFALVFYYTDAIQKVISSVPLLGRTPINKLLQLYHDLIINILPEFSGITVFGKTIFVIEINTSYVSAKWPIIFLFSGVAIRYVINRFVRHQKLKQASSEYWLFITLYFVLAAIVSTLIGWGFIKILVVSLGVVFIIAAGMFKVGVDILKGFLSVIHTVWRTIKIAAMYIALGGAKIAKALRNLVRIIRDIYNAYIIAPFRKAYEFVQGALDSIESQAQKWLDNERLDDEDG